MMKPWMVKRGAGGASWTCAHARIACAPSAQSMAHADTCLELPPTAPPGLLLSGQYWPKLSQSGPPHSKRNSWRRALDWAMAAPLDVRHLEIHVTHACNLKCESCSHYSDQGHKGVVSLE